MQLLKLRGERVEAEGARDGAHAAGAPPELEDALVAAAKSLRAKPALVRA